MVTTMTYWHQRTLAIATLAAALAACACTSTGTGTAPTSSAEPAPGASAAPDTAGARGAGPTAEEAEVGKPAPDFTLTDLDGKQFKLSELRGKTVVLEWFNPECPFVKANHTKGSLKGMAKRYADKGIVWLAINSGGAGKQGHGVEKNRDYKGRYEMSYPILLDETGEVGKRYGAKTTPHMYIIDPQGTLMYKGAIDNTPGSDPEKDDVVINYVENALGELAAGKPITTKQTEAYGCSVKYASK